MELTTTKGHNMNHYFLVNGDTVIEVSRDAYVVPVTEFGPKPTDNELQNAADSPGMVVIPLIETLEWEGDVPHTEHEDFDSTTLTVTCPVTRKRATVTKTFNICEDCGVFVS